MVEAGDKAMMRAVVRRVHPDLFSAFPYEGAQNSESLKVCCFLDCQIPFNDDFSIVSLRGSGPQLSTLLFSFGFICF